MKYRIIHKRLCSPRCIYFPDMSNIEVDFYYDYDGVKHRKDSEKYICTYTNKEVKLNKKCKHCKEKVRVCPAKNVANVVLTS